MSFADLPGAEIIDGYYVVPGTKEWIEMWNNRERRKVREFLKKHIRGFAIKINGEPDEKIIWPVFINYEPKNFECDAIIPYDEEKAKEIEKLIRKYRSMPWDRDKVMEMINRIFDAIEKAGGIFLYWE